MSHNLCDSSAQSHQSNPADEQQSNEINKLETHEENQVDQEIPLLVYCYLKSTGFDDLANEFLKGNVKRRNLLKKYNLSGQPIALELNDYKKFVESLDSNRLTNVMTSMKRYVETSKQLDVSNNKQTYNFSLITHAKERLSKFFNLSSLYMTSSQGKALKNNLTLKEDNIAKLFFRQKLTGLINLKPIYSILEPFRQLQLTKRILGHISAIYCFTLDRTKCTLFTGGEDGLVKVWNLNKCILVATLRGHVKAVNDLSISHQNDRLASCGDDATVRVWCLDTCALLYTLRNGHTSSVISVCFSPYPVGRYRYLVSTCLDGTLCFFKIENDDEIDPTPIKFTEKQTGKNFRINCFTVSPGGTYVALGGTDPMIRIYKMGIKGPVRTMELYGHSDEVESVEFDNHGTRFCSSSKDGSICIWTLSVTSWKCVQIDVKKDILLMSADKLTNSRKKNSFMVNLVSWSCDNKRICCACSDFVIRNYDSCSKMLVNRLESHTDRVTVLCHHPNLSNILLSSGFDGRIYLWDTECGSILKKLDNNLGEQGYGSVYDLAFISNGRDFVMCDYHGNWAIYSTLPSNILDHIPPQQFFHSDYWEIKENPITGKVEDVLVQIEPHLMTPPVIVNYFGIPYNNEVQKLVPGASLLNQETEFNFNHINSNMDSSVSGPGLATSGSVEGVRKTGIIHKKTRNSVKCSYLLWFKRVIVNKLSKMDISADYQMRHQIYKHEQNIHDNIRNKSCGFYDKEERIGRLLRLQSLQKERQMEKETRRVVALQIANSDHEESSPTHIANEVIDENYVDNEFEDFSLSYLPTQSERNSDAEFIDDSDEFQLNNSTFYARTNRSARLRSLRPRTSTGAATSSRRNGYLSSFNNKVENGEPNHAASVDTPLPPLPDDYPSLWISCDHPRISPYVPQINDEVYYFVQGHRLYIQELFQQNVTNLLPTVEKFEEYDHFILPEINSSGYELCKVVDIQYIYKNPLVCKIKLKRMEMNRYIEVTKKFDNAHKKEHFILEFHDMNNIADFIILREIVDSALECNWVSGDRFKSIIDDCWWYGTVVGVSPIDMDFPNSPHLCYSVLWDTGEYDRLSPWDMVSVDTLSKCGSNSCKISDNNVNKIQYIDSFSATSRLMHKSTHLPDFNDDDTIQQQSLNQQPTANPIPISLDEMKTLCERYYSINKEKMNILWGGEDPFVASDRIANAIDNFKYHYIAYAFSMPVDLITYGDYWTMIPHPMDLSKVVTRLKNHYYRSKDAILFDLKLIKLNAISYNKEGTSIVHCAHKLYPILESLINDSSKMEVDLKHPLLAGRKYPTNVLGPSSVKSNVKRHRRRKVRQIESESDDLSADDGLPIASKISSNELMVEWINDAFDLLNYLMNLKDGECFLHPVDLNKYPDYTHYVRNPMDFNTVLNKLKSGIYIHPNEMIDDIKLIFSNSRLYNTNLRSKIYSMTARLSNQFMVRSQSFLQKWSNIAPLKRPLTRSIIRNIYQNYLSTHGDENHDQLAIDGDNFDSNIVDQTTHRYSLRKSTNDTHNNNMANTRILHAPNHRYGTRSSVFNSSFSSLNHSHSHDKYELSDDVQIENDTDFHDSIIDEETTEYSSVSRKRTRLSKKCSYKKIKYESNQRIHISSSGRRSNQKQHELLTKKSPSLSPVITKEKYDHKYDEEESTDDSQTLSIDMYFKNISPIARSTRSSKRISQLNDYSENGENDNLSSKNVHHSRYSLRHPKRF